MINKIKNNTLNNNNISFNSKESALAKNLNAKEKLSYGFIKQRENLSSSRFIQDVTTNWIPKVVFARSLADFTEMTFLEYTESALFYFAPMLLSGALKNSFSKLSPKGLRNDIKNNLAKPSEKLIKESKATNNALAKRALPIKAAIVLGCAAIPAAEYALSFAKNLLTLNVFKKSDFNNIANLNKNNGQSENIEQQEKVRNSAHKHIKSAAIVSAASLAGGTVLATVGHKSETLQKLSRGILRPGNVISKGLEKVGIKSEKVDRALNKYINFDCDIKDGKPVLSKGQLVVSTLVGLFGYSSAGKDRGKLDQLEVLTRVPIVVIYTIFGSEAFDWAFKHILHKQNKFPDLIKKEGNTIADVPENSKLEELAHKIAKKKNTNPEHEFKRLVKEKAVISAVPYGFALVFMGFLLAGITRFWTQYRFNHGVNKNNTNEVKNANTEPKKQSKTPKSTGTQNPFFSFYPIK